MTGSLARRAVISAVIVIAIVGVLIAWGGLRGGLHGLLTSHVDDVRDEMVKILDGADSNDAAFSVLESPGFDSAQDIRNEPPDRYKTSFLKYGTTAVWSLARVDGSISVFVVVSGTISESGFLSQRDESGYACARITGTTENPAATSWVDTNCSDLIEKYNVGADPSFTHVVLR